ncbi:MULTISPECIES: ribosome assembly RNA-binding protein YhbY [Pelistega]|uniref:ribosome assembly RNA-binding protein YhbY n=1 Tax=Pelistega TaxID=106146 RepID=UPI00156491A5|nr:MULTISPECIES: ribosome assembly RNA-binding protein YhbY [Pelistega]
MSKIVLSSKERSTLRAAAHSLKPVVLIGDNGLTPSVLKEIDHSLTVHGLIKVQVAGDDRENRLTIADTITQELDCQLVAHLGKILTLFRNTPEHAHFLAPAKPPLERSRRAPNEEYTPKKLAAAGKTIKDKKYKSSAPKGNDDLAPKKPQRTTSTTKANKVIARPAKPNIPTRKGSALTLRAGRRGR